MKLRIAETFTSIQGEGQWVGVPSYFIRVSGCNLRCTWCDTPYASWHPEGDFVPLADLVSGVDVQHVVITGGEPMLFDAVVELCAMLRGEGHALPPGEEGVPRRAGGRAVDTPGSDATSLPLASLRYFPLKKGGEHNSCRLHPVVDLALEVGIEPHVPAEKAVAHIDRLNSGSGQDHGVVQLSCVHVRPGTNDHA